MERLYHVPIKKSYVFESDVESHINSDELSDLSDVFEDNDGHQRGSMSEIKDSTISLDDIPYDRDLKWINVPLTSRPKTSIINPDNIRMLKAVEAIASGNAAEGGRTGESKYKKGEDKKGRGNELRVASRRREALEGNSGTARHAEYNRARHADAIVGGRAHGHVHGAHGHVHGHNHSHGAHKTPREEAFEGGRRESRKPQGRKTSNGSIPTEKADLQNDGAVFIPLMKERDLRSKSQKYMDADLPQPASAPTSVPMSVVPPMAPSASAISRSASQLNPCAQEFVPAFLSR